LGFPEKQINIQILWEKWGMRPIQSYSWCKCCKKGSLAKLLNPWGSVKHANKSLKVMVQPQRPPIGHRECRVGPCPCAVISVERAARSLVKIVEGLLFEEDCSTILSHR
jgi:hypothetical protein